jgi:phasin family protein
MTKSKTAEKATATDESALETGTAAIKTGMEKALKGYDAFLGYGKDTAEAVTKSATTAGKGFETINSELYSYSKASIEEAVAASKTLLGSKSIHEAFEFQTDFAKSAFEAYVAEVSKISDQGHLCAVQGPHAGLAGHGFGRPRRLTSASNRNAKGPGSNAGAFLHS